MEFLRWNGNVIVKCEIGGLVEIGGNVICVKDCSNEINLVLQIKSKSLKSKHAL